METKDYGVVYVIYNPDVDLVKIGRTKNLPNRLSGLITASGSELCLMYNTKPILEYAVLEKTLHKHFAKQRTRGEWFSISHAEIIQYLRELEKNYEVHEVADHYENGITISEIARAFRVSRSYIEKILKGWNIYSKKKFVTVELAPAIEGAKQTKRVPSEVVYRHYMKDEIPAEFKGNAIYYRIANSLYKHKTHGYYKTRVLVDRVLVEEYFDDREKAESYLDHINLNKM